MPLGELVKERRKRLGWTQAELAERIGVDRSYLSMIETGARKWPRDVVPDLSDALGISQIDMAVAAGLIEPPPAADTNPVALVDPRLTAIVERLGRLSDRELSHVLSVLDFLDGGNHGANTARQPVTPRTAPGADAGHRRTG